MMMVNEMLRVAMNGGTVSDADVKAIAGAILDYEITTGDMSQAWHTCRPEELTACWAAYRTLSARAKALTEPAPLTPEQQEMVDLSMDIARLDEQAQDAEDRDRLGKASQIRAKIQPLKARLDVLVAAARVAK